MPTTPKKLRYAQWLFGVAALGAVIVAANHICETAKLVELFRTAQPHWLLVALLLQVATYLVASIVIQLSLRNDGQRPSIWSLFSLSVAKQFVSQAMPSIGLSGNLLVVKGLENRGVKRASAIFAVLVNLLSYYIAFATVVTVAIVALWWLRDLNTAILVSFTVLLALIVGVSLLVFWMGKNAGKGLPNWLRDRIITPETTELFESASTKSPWEFWPIVRVSGLQLLTFASDAATLYCVLLSLNIAADPLVVLISFVTASAVAAIGLVPGGLGTFEATCVAILHSHGLSVESALAGTLLLRGFTFWLPMIPGLWLARVELRYSQKSAIPATPPKHDH